MNNTPPSPTTDSAPSLEMKTPLQFVPGVGPTRGERLRKLGLRVARDVLFFFPREHEYPPPPTRAADLKEGQPATFIGKITDAELVSRTPGKSLFAAIVENESGAVRIVFYNQAFRAEQLTFDRYVQISGAPKLNGLRWEFSHPRFELLGSGDVVGGEAENDSAGEKSGEQSPRETILPIYPLTEGIQQPELRRLTSKLTGQLADELVEVLPESLRTMAADRLRAAGIDSPASLPTISDAVRGIHHPASADQLLGARQRLVFQELLAMQLALAMRRRRLTQGLNASPLECTPLIKKRILRRFPFELTADQNRVMDQIASDMGRQFPMNRLLQGDVGSGKTVVAIFAMLLAVAGGHQATLMAPTEVLARQHYQTLSRILADSRVRIGLLCGSLTASQRRETIAAIGAGELDLVVGTQALVYDVPFHSLALCVIDEQHKFGVQQRVRLRDGGIAPHYLVMSATPIPRSVAMTQFGDVDLSTLRQKPSGRGTVHTYLADDQWRDRWWGFVRERIAEGRQAFVVAPRVGTESEDAAFGQDPDENDAVEDLHDGLDEVSEDVSSVLKTYESLRTGAFQGLRVGLLHGRMPADEKQSVMDSFAEGELDVLVSTTVIEVGIDVPNATVLTILGANRFGLAQLHQLRGRVSRGSHAGHVCVFTDSDRSPREDERLQVFETTSDGFELAEADFRLRGPGDMLGRRQSGLPTLRIADLIRDQEMLLVARELAQDLIDEDPELDATEFKGLRDQVLRRYEARLDLSDGA